MRRAYDGWVANDLSCSYVEARSTEWLKVKVHQEAEFVICGYTKLAGARQHFEALLHGAYVGRFWIEFTESTLLRCKSAIHW